MKPIEVIADDQIPFLRGALEVAGCRVTYLPVNETDAAAVRHADALLTRTRTRCNAALLNGSKVQFIGTSTIGFDHIDTDYCAEHKITWVSSPGCNAASVGQYAASAIALLSERFGFDFAGRKIAIVGVGNTGKAVSRFARSVGMIPLWVDPPRAENEPDLPFLPLHEALGQADIVSLHVPNNSATRGLADETFFRALKPDAFFINAARGSALADEALEQALKNGKVHAAVLDVWNGEPRPNPILFEKAFLATPHIAGYSSEGKWNGTQAVVRALSRHFGLGIDDWSPAPLPPPIQSHIDLTPLRGLSVNAQIRAALLAAYDPRRDDFNLRAAPERFEQLRWEYPQRREWEAFTVRLPDAAAAAELTALGFQVEGSF